MNLPIKNIIPTQKIFIEISGSDKFDFLQPLITNDIFKIKENPIFAAILTPQGRFLADFFIFLDQNVDSIIIVTDTDYEELLIEKFNMYKLHSKVKIQKNSDYQFYFLLDDYKNEKIGTKSSIFQNPRSEKIGSILILHNDDEKFIENSHKSSLGGFERGCQANLVLESTKFMHQKSFPLEFRFDEQSAIDFCKGCFIGQETLSMIKNRKLLKRKTYLIEAKNDFNIPDENEKIIHDIELGTVLKKLSDKKAVTMINLEKIEQLKELSIIAED